MGSLTEEVKRLQSEFRGIPPEVFAKRRLKQFRFRAGSKRAPVILGKDSKARTIDFISSTEVVDRMGDIVRQDGWLLDNYNGVILWGHDHDALPIGRSVKDRVEDLPNLGPSLVQTIEFATGMENERAEVVHNMLVGGFPLGVSVGFMPIKTLYVEDKDERAELGLGPMGVVYERQELLESSIVTVPANPQARPKQLRQWVQRGGVRAKDLEVLAEWREAFSSPFREMAKRLHSKLNKGRVSMTTKATGVPLDKAEFVPNEGALRYEVRPEGEFDGDLMEDVLSEDPPVKLLWGQWMDAESGESMPRIQSLVFPEEDGWTEENALAWIEANVEEINAWTPPEEEAQEGDDDEEDEDEEEAQEGEGDDEDEDEEDDEEMQEGDEDEEEDDDEEEMQEGEGDDEEDEEDEEEAAAGRLITAGLDQEDLTVPLLDAILNRLDQLVAEQRTLNKALAALVERIGGRGGVTRRQSRQPVPRDQYDSEFCDIASRIHKRLGASAG